MYKDLFSLACDEDCSEWDLGYPVAVLGLQKLLVVNQNKIIVTDFSGKVIKELLSFNESENIYIPMPYGSNQQGVQFQIVSKVNSDYEPQNLLDIF